jgi:hypothetical protein
LSTAMKDGWSSVPDAGSRDRYESSPATYAAEPTSQAATPPLAVRAARRSRSGLPVRTSRAPTSARDECTRWYQRGWHRVTDLVRRNVHDSVDVAADVCAVAGTHEVPANRAVARLPAPVVLMRAVRLAPHLNLAREDIPACRHGSRCAATPVVAVSNMSDILVVERELLHRRRGRKVECQVARTPPLLTAAFGAPEDEALLRAVLGRRRGRRRQHAGARARIGGRHRRARRVLCVGWRRTVLHE